MESKQDILSRLGASIRSYRESAGYSQEDLANMCGYTTANARSTMSKIESGSSDLPVSKLWLIAKALGIRVTDLISPLPVAKPISVPTQEPLTLSSDESDLVYAYRNADESLKDAAFRVLSATRQATTQERPAQPSSLSNAG